MQRLRVPVLFLFFMALAVATPLTPRAVSAAVPAAPTFNRDVLPILKKNCQECHRPGAIAPMSFLTFQSCDETHVTFVGILSDAKANPARTFGTGRQPARPVPSGVEGPAAE